MRLTLFLATSIFLFVLTSCKDKNKSIYEGCCGAEATEDSIEITVKLYNDNGMKVDSSVKARVYIPNVFTPDYV